MLIRRETPADVPAIRAVTAAAFTRPDTPAGGPAEAPLVDALRADAAWLPALSLVAADGPEAVGHVLCTRGRVGDEDVLALGPISVRPDRQQTGVGSALMHAVLGAADALGEPLVALIGNPAFYRKFGFVPGAELGITPPVPAWLPVFQVRTLSAYRPGLRGAFAYARPFDDV